jgi:hypothetical protein
MGSGQLSLRPPRDKLDDEHGRPGEGKTPHYVVADIWDCDAIVGEINARLARGERP